MLMDGQKVIRDAAWEEYMDAQGFNDKRRRTKSGFISFNAGFEAAMSQERRAFIFESSSIDNEVGCIVVLADTKEQAEEIVGGYYLFTNDYILEKEIDLTQKPGVIYSNYLLSPK